MSEIRKSALAVVFWRAVRLAAPMAVLSCGPANLKVVSVAPNACAPGQFATCNSGTVQVETDLPPGTELARRDCDWICASVNCAGEEKRCSVESQPLTQTRLVNCESIGFQGCAVAGRPPSGLALPLHAPTDAHEVFAQMAIFEVASVASFEELAGFLDTCGAPAQLVQRARKAAYEERRHAQVAAHLAGLPEVPTPRVEPRTIPLSLAQLAEENFCEGCINEASSAVTTATQAQGAEDPRVRSLLAQVAAEEFGHAEFSWELNAWLMSRLTPSERSQVHAAGLRKAQAMLEPGLDLLDEVARRQTGLPPVATLRAQSRLLFDELWAPALARLS
jgi:hypothetical protein